MASQIIQWQGKQGLQITVSNPGQSRTPRHQRPFCGTTMDLLHVQVTLHAKLQPRSPMMTCCIHLWTAWVWRFEVSSKMAHKRLPLGVAAHTSPGGKGWKSFYGEKRKCHDRKTWKWPWTLCGWMGSWKRTRNHKTVADPGPNSRKKHTMEKPWNLWSVR